MTFNVLVRVRGKFLLEFDPLMLVLGFVRMMTGMVPMSDVRLKGQDGNEGQDGDQ